MLTSRIEEAAEAIRKGGIVAFPTETVYGLGANAFDSNAVARIFDVKRRPRFDPLIVHVGSWEQLEKVAMELSQKAVSLIETFWPGPLTVIVKKRHAVPDLVTAGLDGVGIRMPRNEIARKLIVLADTPIAAPSANTFGSISPTCAEHVRADLGDAVDLIIDGGTCEVGIESTIISFMESIPILLRPGGIPIENIEEIIGHVEIAERCASLHSSPGRFPKHYAPRTPMALYDRSVRFPNNARIGLLSFDAGIYGQDFVAVEVLSRTGNLAEAASKLFAALKRLDQAGLDLIIAIPAPDHGLGRAINDRLERAAQKH